MIDFISLIAAIALSRATAQTAEGCCTGLSDAEVEFRIFRMRATPPQQSWLSPDGDGSLLVNAARSCSPAATISRAS